jgi:hypothetical protein
MSARHPILPEPIIISEWWKNRGGESIRVRLSTYEGHNLVDLRTWWVGDDGKLKPGKGFACAVKHLPKLADALAKALAQRARSDRPHRGQRPCVMVPAKSFQIEGGASK